MPRPIRICYVLNSFDVGGAETVVLDLARRHDPARYDVTVLAALQHPGGGETEMHRRFREAGVKTVVMRQTNFRSPAALLRLFFFFLFRRFDVVHGHNRPSDYWALRLARLAGVKHLLWTRHLVYQDMTPRQVERYRTLSEKTGRIIAVSDAVRETSIAVEGVAPDRIETVVNGIDTEKYRPLSDDERAEVRAGLGLAPDEAMVLFVGRMDVQKAPESFVELAWKLRAAGRPVRAFMAGKGPLSETVAALIAGGPGGVELLGLRSDVPRLLGACDLFVSTSRNEGLPLNVMEAMTAGAAFVAPAIPQIVTLAGDSPVLSPGLTPPPPARGPVPDDVVAVWAEAAVALLDDPARRRAVGEEGRRIILESFSLELMLARYEGIFDECLGISR